MHVIDILNFSCIILISFYFNIMIFIDFNLFFFFGTRKRDANYLKGGSTKIFDKGKSMAADGVQVLGIFTHKKGFWFWKEKNLDGKVEFSRFVVAM